MADHNTEAIIQAYARADEYLETVLASPQASEDLKSQIGQSLKVIDDAIAQFSVPQLGLSFNGGKDCLVMLVLIMSRLYKRYVANVPGASSASVSSTNGSANGVTASSSTSPKHSLQELVSVYIKAPDSFPDLDEFVTECANDYKLRLDTEIVPMKEALAKYLDKNPTIKAVFVGIRRADPFGDTLQYIQETDHGWPKFVRVHPVLEWRYANVWEFLRLGKVPYCHLYDLGYTSLGGVGSTFRNPALVSADGTYGPAHLLEDATQERAGRVSRAK